MLVRDEGGGGGEGVDNLAEQVRERWTKSICRRSLMTASLAAISVLHFMIYGTFDTFYCCFSAKIG